MDIQIETGDELKGIGTINRVSPYFIWVNDKRYGIKSALKIGILHRLSQSVDVNWSDKENVLSYYETFKNWGCNINGGDRCEYKIYEVKDNMIFHEGEYYLPWHYHDKKHIQDGYIFGFIIKKRNTWYELKDNTEPFVNLFFANQQISQEYIDNQKLKEENKGKLDTIDYLKSINLNYLNSSDLDLFKKHKNELFDDSIFPYTVNNVVFNKVDGVLGEELRIYHRNRTGTIKIDNSYHGRMPHDNQYSLIIVAYPDFTNVCGYESSIYCKSVTFDKTLFDILSSSIVKKWDKAIEDNARYYY